MGRKPKAEAVETVKSGSVSIVLRQYADGRFGYDWKPALKPRKSVRLTTLDAARKAATATAKALSAGRVDLLSIEPSEIEAFREWKARNRKSMFVEDVARELMERKREDTELNPKYVANVKGWLDDFARDFHRPITDIQAAEIESWLRGLGKEKANRNAILAAVSQLFRFARQRDYLPDDRMTEAEKVPRLKIRHGAEIPIWTPGELSDLLSKVRHEFVPWIAIGAFAGIRTEEIHPPANTKDPLRWEDFSWDERYIKVRRETAKTVGRIVPMLDPLPEWLADWRKAKGPVLENADRASNETARLKSSGLIDAWKKNALRHSFISYRLALVKSIAQVAEEAGTSPQTIKRNYLDPQSIKSADKWFSVRPDMPANVRRMTA